MPLYIGDYLADTSRLSTEQHGAYLLLLMDYWRNGPLPNNPVLLANITRLSADAWSIAQALLMQFFSIGEDGLLHNKRIDEEMAGAKANKEKNGLRAKAAAEARWKNAPSNAPSNATSTPQAMLEQCPSPSPSPIKEQRQIPSRGKREPDLRHSKFRSALNDYWESKNSSIAMPWDASDAKQLSRFLEANPTITEPTFRQMLRHRYASRGVNHSDRPRAWLERITDYANGPLNQFKQPEGTANVRKSAVAQNLEDLQDIARRLDEADGGGGRLVSESADREDDAGHLPEGMEGTRRPLLVTAV
jgi:uncharacterized protein YdaU (DUF1376 family)